MLEQIWRHERRIGGDAGGTTSALERFRGSVLPGEIVTPAWENWWAGASEFLEPVVVLALVIDQTDAAVVEADHGVQSTKELERKLTSLAADIAVAEAQWLVWLGEWLSREGWESWGCKGPVDWLQWQCGVAPQTARERVRVARAMRELPMISREFLRGRLSYSKVRALTRVAEPHNEYELAQLGRSATGAQLDKIVRARAAAQAPQLSAWEQRTVRVRRDDSWGVDPVAHITVSMADHDADRLLARVDAEVDVMIADAMQRPANEMTRREFIASRGGLAAMRADALLAISMGAARSEPPEPAPVEIVVNDDDHAEHETSTSAPAEAPSVEFRVAEKTVTRPVGERLCCDPRVAVLVEDSRGSVLGVGRSSRYISRKLRRALARRDRNCCTFPACDASRRLHAHHIIHWSNGGPTNLDNLTLVCDFHHHLVHEGGWSISPTTRRFHKPDGTVIAHVPTERFRGGVAQIAGVTTFDTTAPLGEATNEPFDLGLTLESLRQSDPDNPICVDLSNQPLGPHGPPIPATIVFERIVASHQKQSQFYEANWN